MNSVKSLQKIEKFKDFSRHLSDFPVLFRAYFIFKDFSRKPSKFKYFSSLCKPWLIWSMQHTLPISKYISMDGPVDDADQISSDKSLCMLRYGFKVKVIHGILGYVHFVVDDLEQNLLSLLLQKHMSLRFR